jgi:hypothetical protein
MIVDKIIILDRVKFVLDSVDKWAIGTQRCWKRFRRQKGNVLLKQRGKEDKRKKKLWMMMKEKGNLKKRKEMDSTRVRTVRMKDERKKKNVKN